MSKTVSCGWEAEHERHPHPGLPNTTCPGLRLSEVRVSACPLCGLWIRPNEPHLDKCVEVLTKELRSARKRFADLSDRLDKAIDAKEIADD